MIRKMMQYPSITPTNKGTPNSTQRERERDIYIYIYIKKPCLANPASPTAHFTMQAWLPIRPLPFRGLDLTLVALGLGFRGFVRPSE